MRATCGNLLLSMIPFACHPGTDQRRNNYLATWAFLSTVTFTIMAVIYGDNLDHAHDKEDTFYEGLDAVSHEVAAVATLGLISLVGAFLLGAAHKGMEVAIKACKGEGAEEGEEVDAEGYRGTPMTNSLNRIEESSPLLGGSLKGIRRCNPIDLTVPPTPTKTTGWTFVLGCVGFAVGSLFRPDLFNALSDSKYGHWGAVVLAAGTTGTVVGGVGTLFYYGGVGVAKTIFGEQNSCCGSDKREINTGPYTKV